jgi:ectoine hydroxylase-related dioxygenase (phytanoyl-CoA dioxygenase family)
VYRIRPKLPGNNRGVVPWHQDSGYFAELCDRHLILTVWIPLVDATLRNGCMSILPGAHRQGILTHHTGGNAGFLVIKDEDLPAVPQAPVVAEVPFGGAVLMTNLTPHCSTENHSGGIRWSIDLRYQAAEAPHNAGLWPVEELREDDPRLADYQVACYPPEADFVVQSRLHPEQVADYASFIRRREAFDRARNIAYPRRGWTPAAA